MTAALEKFIDDGFAAASMSVIADRAGVAISTVYSSVGNKSDLLVALIAAAANDTAIESTLDELASETSGASAIGLLARGTREVFERNEWTLGLLYDNAASVPEIATVTLGAVAEYRRRVGRVGERLHAIGALVENVSPELAGEILWFYFGYRAWRDLRELGWDWGRIETWLAQRAGETLLLSPDIDPGL